MKQTLGLLTGRQIYRTQPSHTSHHVYVRTLKTSPDQPFCHFMNRILRHHSHYAPPVANQQFISPTGNLQLATAFRRTLPLAPATQQARPEISDTQISIVFIEDCS